MSDVASRRWAGLSKLRAQLAEAVTRVREELGNGRRQQD